MNIISKLQPIFIISSAIVGVLLGQNNYFSSNSGILIEIFLMILLFFVFIGVDIKEITRSFTNVKFSVASLIINFLWTPLFAFVLGKLLLSGHLDLQIGFLMLLVTPCTDWYLIFTGISKGNVPLGSSILPMNLILQILLLPVYLWLLMGSSVSFAPSQMLLSVLLVLIIPLTCANLIKWSIRKTKYKEQFFNFSSQHGDNIQLIFLCLAVIAMFSSQGKLILENLIVFIRLFVPLTIFFTINFILALLVGKRLKMPFEDTVALLFTTSARNSPISLAIAIIAFPDQPMIALALVIGPLIELPILALDSSILKRINKSNN